MVSMRSASCCVGNDVVNGSEKGDEISSGTQWGNDIINAKGGDDFVNGDQGNDTIDGGAGWDTLSYQATIWPRGAFKGINLNAATWRRCRSLEQHRPYQELRGIPGLELCRQVHGRGVDG